MSLNAFGLGIVLTAKNQASPVFKQVGHDLGQLKGQVGAASRAMGDSMGGIYRDASGRLRDGRGRFVAEAGRTGGAAASALSRAFGAKSGNLFGGLGGLLPGLGAGLGLKGLLDEGGQFAQGLSLLGQKSEATRGELAAFRKAAIDLGLTTTFSPTQAIDGMTALSSAGLQVKEVLDTIAPTLKFTQAAAGKLNTGQVAELAAQAMAMFNVSSKNVGGTMDMMTKAAAVFAMEISDLPLGLANASRGVNQLHASSEDTLVTFGLMRKMMPLVASAGTAVGMTMEAMARKDVQGKLKGLGIAVEGVGGKFRPFLDVIGDMLPEMQKMTQVQRAAFLQTTFGADAVQGLGAIFTQLENGISGANGKLLKGSEAIAFLRAQMRDSTGELDKAAVAAGVGFTGAMEKLTAKSKTAAILIGEELGKIVAPMVDRIGSGLAAAATYFDGLSASAKRNAALITLVVAGLGSVFAAAGGPVTLVLAGIVAGIVGFKAAVDANIGGIGDKFASWVRGAKLAWDGISQLFTQGGFSGAVRAELNKAENSGIKNFAISLFVWGNRIKNFIVGIGEGFSVGLERSAPAFKALGAALERVGVALGLTSKNDPAANVSAWAKAGAVGAVVGEALAGALEWVANTVRKVVDFGTGFASTWKVGVVFDAAREAADQLGIALSALLGDSDPTDSTSGWRKFGEVLGGVASFGANTLAAAIRGVSGVLGAFGIGLRGVGNIIGGALAGDWARVWTGMQQVVLGRVKTILAIVGMFVERLAVAADAAAKVQGIDLGAQKRVSGLLGDMNRGIDEAAGVNKPTQELARMERRSTNEAANLLGNLALTGQVAAKLMGVMPGTEGGERAATMIGSLQSMAEKMRAPAPSVNTQVFLDSEQVAARVESRIQEGIARRGGDPDAN